MVKTIFFDVDGTLISHTLHDVPPSTRAALRQLRDCWRPKRIWSNEDYRRLFREIDERIENSAR